MKKAFIFFISISLCGAVQGLDSPSTPQTVPLNALVSSLCPRSSLWIEGSITQKLDSDTYLITDNTGSMILFLPTDELASLPLPIGTKIFAFGTVDISPVKPSKNEFYAEKVVIADNSAQKNL